MDGSARGMAATWYVMLCVLCHVSKAWAQGQPPTPPPTILTFAHILAPPWGAKPSLPSPHQPHPLGNGGVLSSETWVAASGSSWLSGNPIDQVSFQRVSPWVPRKLAPPLQTKLDPHAHTPCHPLPPHVHPIAGPKPSPNPGYQPHKGWQAPRWVGGEGGKAHIGPCFQAPCLLLGPPI